jgi:hypothetical protein
VIPSIARDEQPQAAVMNTSRGTMTGDRVHGWPGQQPGHDEPIVGTVGPGSPKLPGWLSTALVKFTTMPPWYWPTTQTDLSPSSARPAGESGESMKAGPEDNLRGGHEIAPCTNDLHNMKNIRISCILQSRGFLHAKIFDG